MADLFSSLNKMKNLGGLMKGIATLMPQDNPNTQKMHLSGEISDLQNKAEKIYIEIGRLAVEQYGVEAFGEAGQQLAPILESLEAANRQMEEIQRAEEEARLAEAEASQKRCQECGAINPESTRFCQECGARLEEPAPANICPNCGAENDPGVKFCGECGTRLEAPAPANVCPSCGAENDPGIKFCGECGTRLVP